MWYRDDEEYRLRVTERDWNEMRQTAALRRLVQDGRRENGTPSRVRRVILYLEQMFSPHPVAATIDDVFDRDEAEITRLLSLLAPDGRVLHVENIDPVPDSEEEPFCRPIA